MIQKPPNIVIPIFDCLDPDTIKRPNRMGSGKYDIRKIKNRNSTFRNPNIPKYKRFDITYTWKSEIQKQLKTQDSKFKSPEPWHLTNINPKMLKSQHSKTMKPETYNHNHFETPRKLSRRWISTQKLWRPQLWMPDAPTFWTSTGRIFTGFHTSRNLTIEKSKILKSLNHVAPTARYSDG